nr:hypothetical protein [uncultured Acetatifactor sp.]
MERERSAIPFYPKEDYSGRIFRGWNCHVKSMDVCRGKVFRVKQ